LVDHLDSRPRYLLSAHVHLCVTDDHVVLLDLNRDQYVGVGSAQMNALAACIQGWPTAAAPVAGCVSGPGTAADALLAKLFDAGMLTTDPALGKEAKPLLMQRPEATLTESDLEARPQVSLGQVLNFLKSSAVARLALRRQPISSVVARVRARKERRATVACSVNFKAARQPVAAFLYLRPLLFGARNQCLFDSLALVEFLARYELFPAWVFGVQTGPFLAHSWVQEGAVIFNDTPDYVRRFTPILAV
jgi:hypothetical protein